MKKIDKNLIFNELSASRSKVKTKTKLVKTAQEKKLSKVKLTSLINEDHNLNVRPTF